ATNATGAAAAVVAAALLHRWVEQPARSWGYAWLARRDLARMSLPAPTLVG
ncbi:MAG: hypothetical protein JF597_51025, partial [Streptomyces sp.]|nr:hypothetical protein [Streptomyces sp.]